MFTKNIFECSFSLLFTWFIWQEFNPLLQVEATDQDEGTNADLIYFISNSNNLPFTIDSDGNIRTTGVLDRETNPQYTLLITVLDSKIFRFLSVTLDHEIIAYCTALWFWA